MSFEFIYWYWIYSANNWGIYVNWGVSLRPLAAGLQNVFFSKKCTYSIPQPSRIHISQPCARRAHRHPPIDIYPQLLAEYIQYQYINGEFRYWYWIYSANNWGDIWRVSVRPLGAQTYSRIYIPQPSRIHIFNPAPKGRTDTLQ